MCVYVCVCARVCVCELVCVRARAHVRKEGGKERMRMKKTGRAQRGKLQKTTGKVRYSFRFFIFFSKTSSSFPHHSRLLPNGVVSGTFGMALLLLFLLIPRPPTHLPADLSRPEGFLLTLRGSRICRPYQRPARVLFLFLSGTFFPVQSQDPCCQHSFFY